MHAFREYEGEAKWDIARWEHHYGRLTPAHKVRPPGRAGRRAGNPAPDAQRRSPSSGPPLPSRGRVFLPPPLTRTPPPQEMLPHFPAKFQALRRAAAQNQALMVQSGCVAPLVKLLGSPSASCQKFSARALARLAANGAVRESVAGAGCLSGLVALARSPEADVRRFAVMALCNV